MKKLAILYAVLILLFAGCQGASESSSVGDIKATESPSTTIAARFEHPMPAFSKLTLTGDSLSSSSLAGQVTLVNFWATWCGPCIVETPALVALKDEWKDRSFEIIGISMDEEGFDAVEGFADEFQIPYPIILDDGRLADEFGGVYALPTTYVVDKEGTIRHRFIGVFPVEEMKSELSEMIETTERLH